MRQAQALPEGSSWWLVGTQESSQSPLDLQMQQPWWPPFPAPEHRPSGGRAVGKRVGPLLGRHPDPPRTLNEHVLRGSGDKGHSNTVPGSEELPA